MQLFSLQTLVCRHCRDILVNILEAKNHVKFIFATDKTEIELSNLVDKMASGYLRSLN